MAKKAKEVRIAELKAKLAKIEAGEDVEDEAEEPAADPREAKMVDLIAKGVDKAITARQGRGQTPPDRDKKGVLDALAEMFGVKE